MNLSNIHVMFKSIEELGILAFVLVYSLSYKQGLSPMRILLVGIAIQALFEGLSSAVNSATGGDMSGVADIVNGNITMKTWSDVTMLFWYAVPNLLIAMFCAKKCDLIALEDRTVKSLSGGQKQRVWIAMALAQGTKILLLDEPTTYLDVRYQLQILRLVNNLNRKLGITIIIVLHDINQSLAYSDEVIALSPNGTIISKGKPQKVITPEVISKMYSINLEMMTINEKPFVITV